MEDNKLRNIGILLLVLYLTFRCTADHEPYDDNSFWMDGGR